MIFRESEHIELKSIVVDDIKKEVIAFANCGGGTIYIGVNDDGEILGIDETDGDSFEKMRSLEQELTFENTAEEFERRNVPFGSNQMQTLKIKNKDGIYTNLGLLLSEQCRHTIKVAVFQGADQSEFHDRREFGGSLIQQMNDVYDFLDLNNQTHSTFNKLLRIDTRNYPEVAVREALLNALVHRDYAFMASTLISIYSDRMEFVSIGGLLSGITLDDIMLGISVCRNQNLANVFYRLELIEAYGTGMRKIMDAYAGFYTKPSIEVSEHAFKIILPNMNNQIVTEENILPDDNENKILDFVRNKGSITRADVEKQCNTSASTATRLLRYMTKQNLLIRVGKGKNTRYILQTKRTSSN
jgi:ATP-dependent DNA helicase RecG